MFTYTLHNTRDAANPAWTYFISKDGKIVWQPAKLWRYQADAERAAKRYCTSH